MNVKELIELLSEFPEDAEVRLAEQPSYPFEYSISDVKELHPFQGDIDEAEELISSGTLTEEELAQAKHELEGWQEKPTIVYITEGTQLGYASRDLWA